MEGALTDWLVDTNVLVYPYDAKAPEKAARAIAVLERLGDLGNGAVSAQVLSEWFNVMTRPRFGMPIPTAVEALLGFVNYWHVFDVTGVTVMAGVRAVERFRLQPYDAMIWASAHLAAVPFVLSEDFSHGQTIEGVTFVNPFREDFDLDLLASPPHESFFRGR